MSNKTIAYLNLRIRELELKLAQKIAEKRAVEARNVQLEREAEEKDHQLAVLRQIISETEREKWSFQSELENLRGY